MPKAVLPATFLKALSAQFPTAIGVVPVKQGNHHGAIVAFDTVEAQTKACSIGVQVGSLTIIGTQTLSSDNSTYRISLDRLPILRPEELTPLVRQMLEPYGKVLHITTALSSLHGQVWKLIVFTVTNLDTPKPPVPYLKVVSSSPATDVKVHNTYLKISQNKGIIELGLSDPAWIPCPSEEQPQHKQGIANIQVMHHVNTTTNVSVSYTAIPKIHSVNANHSTTTLENNYNIMKQPNNLVIKVLDKLGEDTDSNCDYQPSADDQSEDTESDTEEHGSDDEMDLDEEVCILQEETRVAHNSPNPSSDQL
ncbi:hypothetical protein G6F46_012437 [Rhizopus delemar]|uniref:Uncharacterized protein n=3 Tax=Rhizopus TaxID=4842 RepID=I1CIK6_RHIO9|nr:hypothetical protein RO3G_12997 [Rhizopus delemar RA 99-880]KAG1449863.1 hypothetical protein G6F55_009968 [Rhizopus delemar]KAG1533583.1 hypothetical protein G6F51_012538 [Rhizopus arrhizus]KAG1488994.1 hypothetical protein G6F54_011759 [Rhizopus delemar]KAG1503934.1 hypothetical protein G6F53_010511 [Rhizopus delemar]|eukprot:EIE88286.1 hypothetical protein RO3G_12997 [Rhizopus delemar RA 99-880]